MQKAHSLKKNIESFSGEKKKMSEEWAISRKQKTGQERRGQERKSHKSRQKNKKEDTKVESNNKPEIQDSKEILDVSGVPSGLMCRIVVWLVGF